MNTVSVWELSWFILATLATLLRTVALKDRVAVLKLVTNTENYRTLRAYAVRNVVFCCFGVALNLMLVGVVIPTLFREANPNPNTWDMVIFTVFLAVVFVRSLLELTLHANWE